MIEVGIEAFRPTEKQKNLLSKDSVKKLNKFGDKYLTASPKSLGRSLGDWKFKNQDVTHKQIDNRVLTFSKGKNKEELNIYYKKQEGGNNASWQFDGIYFTPLDGKSVVSLYRGKDNNWKILRKNKDGSNSSDLSPKEWLEISNFLFKFNIDKNVNSIVSNMNIIVDKVDPDKIYRYVVPVALTAGFAGHAALANFAKPNDATALNQAFINRPTLSQPLPDAQTIIPETETKLSFESQHFFDTAKADILIGPDFGNSKTDALGRIQEMEIVTKFYLPGEKKDGQTLERDIRRYLKDLKFGDRYVYRQYGKDGAPGKALVGDLEKVLIEIRNNPYSQKSVFDLLDALHQYDTGKPLVTPDQIMLQAGIVNSGPDASFQDVWDTYWKNQEVYQAGPIKGYSVIYETVSIGDLLVSNNLIGRVISTGKDSIIVWTYDQKSGEVQIKSFSPDNFPNPAIGFR